MIKPNILFTEKGKYPFYMSKGIQDGNSIILVEDNICYENDTEYNILKEKILLRKTLFHPYLLCMQDFTQQIGSFKIFYEYVHLQMNGQIGNVLGKEFFKKIEQQILSLVDFLWSKNLRFHFDPKNIGISEQMNVKYFLQDFNISQIEDKQFFRTVNVSVMKYFQKFQFNSRAFEQQNIECASSFKTEGRFSTQQLSKRAQQNKKKSLYLLHKLKRL